MFSFQAVCFLAAVVRERRERTLGALAANDCLNAKRPSTFVLKVGGRRRS